MREGNHAGGWARTGLREGLPIEAAYVHDLKGVLLRCAAAAHGS